MLTSRGTVIMFHASDDESKVFARALLKRIAFYERSHNQVSFLRELSQTPLFDQLILRGGCALHGVFLGQRDTMDVDFIATPEVKSHFYETAQECGLQVELSHGKNGLSEYILAGKVYSRVSMAIDIWARSEESFWELATLNFPSQTDIAVRVQPLAHLLAEKLRAITYRGYEVDFLDIWFGLVSDHTLRIQVKQVLESRINLHCNIGKALCNLDSLEGTWTERLDALLSPVPQYEKVRRDLYEMLPFFSPNEQ